MIIVKNGFGRHALRTLAAASIACTACAGLFVAPARALPRYDGLWSVLIVTRKGDCDRAYRYPVRISHGRLANAGGTAIDIAGRVGPTGHINVTVSSGSKSASGFGRLAGAEGAGMWRGGSCSGTWTAERRGL
jgi:hypothetical protein